MVRIALIHAIYVAMQPIESAFRRRWPEARRVNLVDDALPADLERDGMLTHFSTATALDAVQRVLRCPVLSAPEAAVDAPKRLTLRQS